MDVLVMVDGSHDNGTDYNMTSLRLEDLDYFKLHPALTITYLIVMTASTFIGIIGNTMVIGGVCVYGKLRTKANIFIINLAIADTCVAIVVQGFSIVGLTVGYKFFVDKGWLCHAVATICLVSCSCSLWNMGAIAVNRYICLCRKRWYHAIYTWRKSVAIAVCLWIICILLEIPNYFQWGGHTFDAKTMACSYDRTASYSYTIFFVLVAIAPPLLILLACYALIFIYVKKTRRTIKKMCGKVTQTTQSWRNSELRLAKTLFIIFVVFLLCWSPYAVVVLIDKYDQWPKVVYVVIIQMAHTNSSLNSIIYAASNKDFREGYKRLICYCRYRGRPKKGYISTRYMHKHSDSSDDVTCETNLAVKDDHRLRVPSIVSFKKLSGSYTSVATNQWTPTASPVRTPKNPSHVQNGKSPTGTPVSSPSREQLKVTSKHDSKDKTSVGCFKK